MFWFIWSFPFQMPWLLMSAVSFNDSTQRLQLLRWYVSWTISAMVLGFFPVLFRPVSDSTFSACPPSSVDNVFSFSFMRQTQGILIPSPKPGEEKPTSGVYSQLEDLFWHSLLWNPTQITFCLNTLQAWQKGALWGESVKKPVSHKSFCKCQTSRLQIFFPPGQLLFGFKSS